jgi:hypothetical protein
MTRGTNCYRQSNISLLVVAVANIVLHINHSNLFGSSIHVSTYTTCRLPKTDEQYTTTIDVTAYFPFKKSKHTTVDYHFWLKNRLESFQSHMVIAKPVRYPQK